MDSGIRMPVTIVAPGIGDRGDAGRWATAPHHPLGAGVRRPDPRCALFLVPRVLSPHFKRMRTDHVFE